MRGALEIRLDVGRSGVTPRAYSSALLGLTQSLEDLDRLAEPNPKDRARWFVADTKWRSSGPVVRLQPEVRRAARSMPELLRPSQAFVAGIEHLHRMPEIPADFTERIVERVAKLSALTSSPSTGLRAVSVIADGAQDEPARIDETVETNARRATHATSLAYGSLVGRLDMISARRRTPQIGLVADYGPPVTCNVGKLDPAEYLAVFNHRVMVEGIVKRNGSGQVVRIEVDRLTAAPARSSIGVTELRGALENDGRRIADFIEEQRGR